MCGKELGKEESHSLTRPAGGRRRAQDTLASPGLQTGWLRSRSWWPRPLRIQPLFVPQRPSKGEGLHRQQVVGEGISGAPLPHVRSPGVGSVDWGIDALRAARLADA